MASKKKRWAADPYSEAEVRRRRKFPVLNSILMGCLLLLQICFVLLIVFFDPQPQDVINEYEITVEPLDDGSLNIEYRFVWTPLDEFEPLTWVEIGMPNEHFTVYPNSLTGAVQHAEKFVDGYDISIRLDLVRAYTAGETLEFSFVINQKEILCSDQDGYFYELIPGWFNATPVEHYTFRWKDSMGLVEANADLENFSDHVWEGEMPCGTYVPMKVRYSADSFRGAKTVQYQPFDDEGVTNELRDSKIGATVFLIFLILLLVAVEVYLTDSFVSYGRGRGFLVGYGHRVHTYGRVNPRYRSEKAKHSAGTGRGSFSGGCACACACACAGGGRAGCSQKDTWEDRSPSLPAVEYNERF